MENLPSCIKFLKELQVKHSMFFNKEKNIFFYVDAIETDRVKVYIIDEHLPQGIIAEIAAVYKVIHF